MSHGPRGSQFDPQKDESVNWFWKFVSHLLKKQAVRPLRNLRGERCASEQPKRPLFVWTREEAETAWHTNRTEVNLALTLPENVTAVRSSTGVFVVDGKPARVVICVSESAKQWMAKQIPSIESPSSEPRPNRLREASSTTLAAGAIQEKKAKEERQKMCEKQWLENGCVKDPAGNWTVPDELMWRSLPHGEDR